MDKYNLEELEIYDIESNIVELRKKSGYTQEELADEVDVATSTIRNWEKGRTGLQWMLWIAKLCAALNCEPSDLIKLNKR